MEPGGGRAGCHGMAARAIWKGTLEIGELACPVALHAAASSVERVSFHILNRRTGHRVRRVYVDAETGETVEQEDQAKQYTTAGGDEVILDPDEIADVLPDSDKRLTVETFVRCAEVDRLYLDRPYYLSPADRSAETAFAVIRDAIAQRKVAALARAVLFRRVRTVLIRSAENALWAHTLEFEHEVISTARGFKSIAQRKVDQEMLDLAEHIIKGKRGRFDPDTFVDRYDDALTALVRAKVEGKPLPPPAEVEATKPSDLLRALRDSTKTRRKAASDRAGRKAGKRPPPQREAG